VDAVRFEELARRALAAGDAAAAREAIALYGGELLPADRYEEWAETRREQLRQSHLDLLRLDGRWEAVAELDPGDERAHLALMRRHAANGDRHAALRQFDRLDRALRQELGVAPGPEASALRDRMLAAHDVFPRRDGPLIGRDLEISIAERALLDAAAGGNRTLIISGEAGAGKGLLLIVDAVQDADDGSLRLLHYLARSARGQRVCIVLAHRPVPAANAPEAATALEATRRSLIDRYGAAELRLGPLADRDATALIRRYVTEPPAELVKLVTTLGRGVPFLVTELARQAAARPDSAGGQDWARALQDSMFARLRPGSSSGSASRWTPNGAAAPSA